MLMAKKLSTDENFVKWIEEKFNHIIENQERTYNEVKKTNGRVTVLEQWKNRIKGAWYAVIIMAMVFGAMVGWWITIMVGK